MFSTKKLVVICDIGSQQDEETGEKKNIAKIRWLAYVKTEYAQRFLIRYFEKQLG